jgi:hypothetical protein
MSWLRGNMGDCVNAAVKHNFFIVHLRPQFARERERGKVLLDLTPEINYGEKFLNTKILAFSPF